LRARTYLDDGTPVWESEIVEIVERVPILAGSPTIPVREADMKRP